MSKLGSGLPAQPVRLCHISELADNVGREFRVQAPQPITLFVLKHGENIVAYYNECPHTGVGLNWSPGVFLDIDNHYIQCSMHGALFRITDGFCEYGPCTGDQLRPVQISVEYDEVLLCDAELAAFPVEKL